MGKFTGRSKWRIAKVRGKEKRVRILEKEKFEKFNPSVLSLGNIGKPPNEVDAIAAVFDLSGFTKFCSHSDPHLVVPQFLNRFLDWLFEELKQIVLIKKYKEGVMLYTDLPFLAKFLGDGVLFLWNTKGINDIAICNVVALLWNVRAKYEMAFYPEIKRAVTNPPTTLRCGIARGRVLSVGNGEDYVGPCINIASRLQKQSLLTFCVSRNGFDFEKHAKKNVANYLLEYATLPGIGEELIWIRKEEFKKLPKEEKKLFREP